MVSWQELPPSMRERLKQRLTPDKLREYIENREKAMDRHVETILEDIERNERAAEIAFELNQEKMKNELREKPMESVVDVPPMLKEKLLELRQAFREGRFRIDVEAHDEHPHLSVTIDLPEGTIAETLPVKPQLQKTILARASGQ
jgi:hypothetical protein